MQSKASLAQLEIALSPGALRTDTESLEKYGRDWYRLQKPAPLAVAFPSGVDEVAAIIKWARMTGTAIVPSGGRTGLAGGALAHQGQLVVSAERMNKVLAVSRIDRQLTAEAGATIRQVHQAAAIHDLMYPIDFAPSDTMQVGGTIATNAGGVNVLRYGMTRNYVAGLVVVTGTGEVLDLSLAVPKNNTGYDLKQLFIGSEGTLGIITEATLRLVPAVAPTSVALVSTDKATDLPTIAQLAQAQGILQALEFWDDAGMELGLAYTRQIRPLARAKWYVLAEFESPAAAHNWIEVCQQSKLITSAVSATPNDPPSAILTTQNLWSIRLSIGSAVAPFIPYKNDISVPVVALPSFLPQLQDLLHQQRPDNKLVIWGHLGDGNLHINCLKPDHLSPEAFAESSHAVDEAIFSLVSEHSGSISAEHGIGLLKKHALHYSRSLAEVAAMRSIKSIFDPDNIMNPGKIFD